MNDKYQAGMLLVNDGEYQESYQYFSDMISLNPDDYDALYFRGMVDFIHLKKHLQQTLQDFATIQQKSAKYRQAVCPFLTLIYDMEDDFDKVIYYGEQSLKMDTPLAIDVHFALARAYQRLDVLDSSKEALKHIDICLAMEPDEFEDFYICKCEILLGMERFSDVDDLLNLMMTKYGASATLYYLKGRHILAQITDDASDYGKKMLEAAYGNFQICLQYEDYETAYYAQLEILNRLQRYDQAFALLDQLQTPENEPSIIVEKVKIYEELEQYDQAVVLCQDFLQHHKAWKVEYSLGYLLNKLAKNNEDLKHALVHYQIALKEATFQAFLVNDIFQMNRELGNHQDNYDMLMAFIAQYPENGQMYYLLAEAGSYLEMPYQKQIDAYEMAYVLGFLNELEYFDSIAYLVDKPKKVKQKLKKYRNFDVESLDLWSRRRMGLRYLYGEDGFPIDFLKAKVRLQSVYQADPEEACYITAYARCVEIVDQDGAKAFQLYQQAYAQYQHTIFPQCNCPAGYLAHAYIQGVGTQQNMAHAKQIILGAIQKQGAFSSSTVLYLYAYFYLCGEPEFDGDLAQQFLETRHPFYRYEISRILMLEQIYRKRRIDAHHLQIEKKETLKHVSKYEKAYYKKNMYAAVTYPCFNNY